MSQRRSRRSLLAAAATATVGGCLADREPGSDDDSGDGDGDGRAAGGDGARDGPPEPPEGCDVPYRSRAATGEPIETTAEPYEDRDEEPEWHCAAAAAEAALDHLDERTDLDLREARWIGHSVFDDGEYHARVTVRASKDSRDGEYHFCPDPAFDVDEALDSLPRRVDVTLVDGDGSELVACSHEITLYETTYSYD